MDPGNRKSIENLEAENKETDKQQGQVQEKQDQAPEQQAVPVYAETAPEQPAELEGEDMHLLALAYAKYLAEHDMEPGDATTAPEEAIETMLGGISGNSDAEISGAETPGNTNNKENGQKEKESNKRGKNANRAGNNGGSAISGRNLFRLPDIPDKQAESVGLAMGRSERSFARISKPIDLYDKVQYSLADGAAALGRDFITAGHRITSSYRQSRRVIGIAILVMGIAAAAILAVFDNYTVYEYSYNGKILGYVKNQDDVVDVLDIAGTQLTENSTGGTEIKFVPNQNVTFRVIDSRGKSIDDADIAVNKLVYMTDIETEAYSVYDGDKLVAIVKSENDAERLLNEAKNILSTPDDGMVLVSSEFTNDLDIRPINVLLTSIQSNADARQIMTEGGSAEFYHIVEQDESIRSLARTFGVDPVNIYDESNKNVITAVEQGDKVCIHEEISPVNVKMVEKGRMKEIIEFETVKQETDEYYKGDTYVKQDGVNGVQIFEGSITKVAGEVTRRKTDNIEVITEKQDKIILVGTAERPKTAPTGTFIVPLQYYQGITSNFGYRWGRLHSGIDMGAAHGTPIYAADGGTVTKAGWYYGYGLCVDIDHGNGRVTRYGHCSSILVNVGDLVYQGQNIALVGNTGHSFGNHLHFEVQINGSPVNPRPYIGL